MLRRAMITEFSIGAAIMAITTIMVVSPPATANDASPSAVAVDQASPAIATSTVSPVIPPVSETSIVAPITTTPPAVCTVSAVLQLGATGPDVICLQQALAAAGVYNAEPTGIFDDVTDTAVRSFQAANALLDDGIVGPVTGSKLGIWPGE